MTSDDIIKVQRAIHFLCLVATCCHTFAMSIHPFYVTVIVPITTESWSVSLCFRLKFALGIKVLTLKHFLHFSKHKHPEVHRSEGRAGDWVH